MTFTHTAQLRDAASALLAGALVATIAAASYAAGRALRRSAR